MEHDNITVAEWLEINKNKWKKTTLIQCELAVKNHMKPLLGHYKLKKLNRATYQTKYINELERKFKPGTVKLLHSLFKIAINAAIEEEILARNRFIKIVIKDEDTIASKAKINFLTPMVMLCKNWNNSL
uniref:tyrosine-type recombinase/integrase n=1 Tax=Metasolibacillus sp. FSL K6-0083 TaxID=2921416 RepID=UPI00406C862B